MHQHLKLWEELWIRSLHVVFSACPIFAVCSHWVATVFGSWPTAVSEVEPSFRNKLDSGGLVTYA